MCAGHLTSCYDIVHVLREESTVDTKLDLNGSNFVVERRDDVKTATGNTANVHVGEVASSVGGSPELSDIEVRWRGLAKHQISSSSVISKKTYEGSGYRNTSVRRGPVGNCSFLYVHRS